MHLQTCSLMSGQYLSNVLICSVETEKDEEATDEDAKSDAEKTEKAEKSEKVDKQEEEKQARGKPIASHAVTGTGWYIVWTGDGKIFFFNPTSKTSIWERPTELEDNEKVDEIIKRGPHGKKAEGRFRNCFWF